jgi:hypothetical protein
VYLFTCTKCKLQYVGYTEQKLSRRLSQHKSGVSSGDEQYFYQHFRLDGHSVDNMSVQVIYKADEHHVQFENKTKLLKAVEEYYQRILCAHMPFGLCDKIDSSQECMTLTDFNKFNCTNTPFFSHAFDKYCVQKIHQNERHKNRKNNKSSYTATAAMELIDRIDDLYGSFNVTSIYRLLRSSSVKLLNIAIAMIENNGCRHEQTKLLILAYRSNFIKPTVNIKKQKIFWKIEFSHKALDSMHINSILHKPAVRNLLPEPAKHVKLCTSFTYVKTIGSAISNYNKTLSEIDTNYMKNLTCDCSDNGRYAEFIDSRIGHIHTGKMEIIENHKLREIMQYGAKFRETKKFNRERVAKNIESSLDDMIQTICKKCKLELSQFEEYRKAIIDEVSTKLDTLKVDKSSKSILNQPEVKQYLSELHKKFVIVPVDKASNNFAVICKKYYLDVLYKELNTNSSYEKCGDITAEMIFDDHAEFLKNNFGIKIDDSDKHIPYLYWTSKQHKDPFKHRYIAGAYRCTTSSLSKDLAAVLKCVKTYFKNYCGVIKRKSGISRCWSIDNSTEFVSKVKNVNASSIYTYDFSTLYTNLPHDDIKESLNKLLIKMFNTKKQNHILVNSKRNHATFSDSQSYDNNKQYKRYTLDMVIESLSFILDNTYIQFAGEIYRQIIGIPMGGNACPFIADLYLAWKEFVYVTDLVEKKKNFKLAKSLNNNCRYIDDIITLNIPNFGEIAPAIYGNLKLEKSSDSGIRDTFLDLYIRIHKGLLIIGIYHKVDDFNFDVINFPFPESNISHSEGPKCFYSQLIRFSRLCNNLPDFSNRVRMTYNKLTKRGYDKNELYNRFNLFCAQTTCWKSYHLSQRHLWKYCTETEVEESILCEVHDIRKFTKPCSISLYDVTNPSSGCKNIHPYYLNILEKWQSQNISMNTVPEQTLNISEELLDQVITEQNFKVTGFDNKANFCYLNSIYQVLICILLHNGCTYNNINSSSAYSYFATMMYNFKFNEGYKRNNRRRNLHTLRSSLGRFFPLLNGVRQQDAHEALLTILNCIHDATKKCLIADIDISLMDDSMMTSWTYFLFRFAISNTYECTVCKFKTHMDYMEEEIILDPTMNSTTENLIKTSMKYQLEKDCTQCTSTIIHSCSKTFSSLPRILRLIIKRFDNNLKKVNTPVNIPITITVSKQKYNLVGIIHHINGNTDVLHAGHYTATINYKGFQYADDLTVKIQNLNDLIASNTAYIIFYKKA